MPCVPSFYHRNPLPYSPDKEDHLHHVPEYRHYGQLYSQESLQPYRPGYRVLQC